MHAVVVRVTVDDPEASQQRLRDDVVPQASRAPGFQAGYWTRTRDGNNGLSMAIFDSEENARAAAERVPAMVPEGVTMEGVEVREVVASA
jgi:hypothetical protein